MTPEQIEALREAAKQALWTGHWYNEGCGTVACQYADGDGTGEIAHPEPNGLAGYLPLVQPSEIIALLDFLAATEARLHEVAKHCAEVEQGRDALLMAQAVSIVNENSALRIELKRMKEE
jgi:hypothetical protein